MPIPEPLPFLLRVPGEDTLDLRGIRSVSYRVDGLLHLVDSTLVLEWTGTQTTEAVEFTGVKSDRDLLPLETLEVPVAWIAEVRIGRGWLRPRLVLRARRLDAFDGVPGSKAGAVPLSFRRRYREIARAMQAAIEAARDRAAVPSFRGRPELEPPDITPVSDSFPQ